MTTDTSQPAPTDLLEQAVAWRADGRAIALATVTATWGSSPRPVGSLLLVDGDGEITGSVSGGCVEGAVVDAAIAVIGSGQPQTLDFGVTDEMAWEVGLACGGEMQVFVQRVGPTDPWLERLQSERAAKRPAAVSLDLENGERHLVDLSSADEIALESREVLRTDRARILEQPDRRLLLLPFNPPLRLVIVGAVHIAQPLSRMAIEVGYDVTIVDPRTAFATDARFPGVRLVREWPDEALEALAIDGRTAIVTLTHDPKLDDPALLVALRSTAFYVGSLGSRRTQARRLERMRELGLESAAAARLHGPVGLDIGARSPAEIAVSILAQITARLRRPGDDD
jgi:xanthine dehydrogenase accessory factor